MEPFHGLRSLQLALSNVNSGMSRVRAHRLSAIVRLEKLAAARSGGLTRHEVGGPVLEARKVMAVHGGALGAPACGGARLVGVQRGSVATIGLIIRGPTARYSAQPTGHGWTSSPSSGRLRPCKGGTRTSDRWRRSQPIAGLRHVPGERWSSSLSPWPGLGVAILSGRRRHRRPAKA
jgi:hypothetical protein